MGDHRRSVFSGIVLGCAVMVALTVGASFLGTDLFIPSVGRGEGASGSQWYTTLWLHNPGDESAVVTVSMLLRGQANTTPDQQVVTVPAGSTLTYEDVIHDLFGLDSVAGALRFQSEVQVAVGSRVFNQPGESISESQGQLIAAIPATFSIAAGESLEVPGVVQPADGSFRSNFGFVETSGATTQLLVTLLDGSGLELASANYILAPYAAFQRSLRSLAPDAVVEGGALRVEVIGSSGAVIAYASAVANGVNSQDPTTLEMTLDGSAIGSGPDGGITGVVAGPGLAGGGSDGEVALQVLAGDGIEVSSTGVSIRPGGVTAQHIAPGAAVLGVTVDDDTLTDSVGFEAGANVAISADDGTVTISALECLGERVEVPVSQSLVAGSAGTWTQGGDGVLLPGPGRWRIGYRVLVEIHNNGISSLSDPVNIALYDATRQELVRASLSVVGLQVDLGTSAFSTVSGEAVVDVDGATTIGLIARTSSNDLVLTVHPHDVDLSAGLPGPNAASFLFSECLGRD